MFKINGQHVRKINGRKMRKEDGNMRLNREMGICIKKTKKGWIETKEEESL